MTHRERMIYGLGADLGIAHYDIERILRDLPRIQRAHEADCSEPDENARLCAATQGDRAFSRVATILRNYSNVGQIERQCDPRGACIIVHREYDGLQIRLGSS